MFTKFATIYDEIEDIITQVQQGTLQLPKSNIDSFSWKRIQLPTDFTYLIASVSPLLAGDDYFINLDFTDLITICHLNTDTKTCINGHIELLEISCAKNDTSILKRALTQLPNQFDILLNITGDLEPTDAMNLIELIKNYAASDSNMILGVRFDENIVNRCNIQAVCYIPDSAKEA